MRVLASVLFLSLSAFAQTCVPVATLKPVDSVTATLADDACRLPDGSLFDAYSLTLPTFGQLQLSVSSSDFPVTLFLRDSDGRAVASGASIQQTIERGEYTLLVNAQGPAQSGAYTLTSAFTGEPNTQCRGITRIGPSGTVAGHLADTSCRQLNQLPYDGYLVSILGSGTLSITLSSPNFSGTVTLRDDNGQAAGSDPLSVSASVNGDTDYTIIVAGADPGARGDYQIALAFTPAPGETCHSQGALNSQQTVRGMITESSCQFDAPLLYQYYDLAVPVAGLADLRGTTTSAADILIAILDQNGRLISQDLESGGLQKPILRQQLPAGSYTALVITDTSGVNYSLQFDFSPGPAAACPALTLAAGAPQSGGLAGASSCHAQSAMQDTYTFTTRASGVVDITLTSDDFDGSLLLTDGKGNNFSQSDGDDTQNAHIVANLPAGDYEVNVLSADPGSYNIAYNFTSRAVPDCPGPQNLALNSGFVGQLGSSTCAGSDGQPVDWYQFTTGSDGDVALFMTSTVVDAYLTLTDGNGNVLRRDDNSYGGADAMIVQWLPAGTYTFSASASGGSQTGRYQVNILFADGPRPPGCLPLGDLQPGTTQGSIYITSCQYSDDTFGDIYRIQVLESGNLNIEMDSDSVDSFLILLDPSGNVVDFDDDSAGGANALLTTAVEPGTYYLAAKPFTDQGYVVGPYVLVAR